MNSNTHAFGRFHRRHFLTGSAALVTATSLTSLSHAIDPIKRNGEAKFKYSLAAYSYRNLLKGDKAELTLHDFIDDCAAFGLEAAS